MTKQFYIIATILVILVTGQNICGQSKAVTFSNDTNNFMRSWGSKDTGSKSRYPETKINEITLNPDGTFEFWSRPYISCFTWQDYKGTWKKNKDSLVFSNSYQIKENDTKATYARGAKQEFVLTFKTDKGTVLKNRRIKIQYEYDYDAHINSPEKIFSLDANNSVVIAYKDIPDLNKLAAIRIEYLLNFTEKRFNYLTENNPINRKDRDVPNIIEVEFVETPKTEIVYRTIKAVVKHDVLKIISTSKTKTILPDYFSEIEFEDSYSLNK